MTETHRSREGKLAFSMGFHSDRLRIAGSIGLMLVLMNAGCDNTDSGQTTTAQMTPTSVVALNHTNVVTYHNDVQRTGQNLTETVLTHTNVQFSSFGKLFSVPVDGKVDAQPLYLSQVNIPGQGMRSVVYAATEHDSVYAFDAGAGTIFWHANLAGAGESPSDDRGCGQVTPEIGVTATPVIDTTAGPHGTIYLLAMSKDASGVYHHRLHAIDITTGQEEFGGPVEIAASFAGVGDNSINGQVVFDAKQYKSRPGLLLLNGVVYTGWGSHCDIRPYMGWLMGYDQLTLGQTSVFNFAPNGSEAALWNAGGGISADPATGRIFVSVSNGTFDTNLNQNGLPAGGDFGNSFVKLNVVNRQLIAEDYWTMNETLSESAKDEDLGSGGVLLVPDLKNGTGQVIQLGTGAGKDGRLYVFNRANMGKFDSPGNTAIYQELSGALGGAVFSSPAWFNGTLYYGAVSDRIRAFGVSNAVVQSQPTSATDNYFEYPGAAPSISANGTSDAILWAVENKNPAVLHAYDATNLATELYNSSQATSSRDEFGPGNKFITPTIADGRVIVGTQNSVAVFGLIK